jgi:aminopeptidase N
VALGAGGDTDIDAELETDNTASGQRRAATARALRPTPAAKAEAWRLATTDTGLPNAIIESILRGFDHPAQVELLAPYVQPYFDVIADIWAQRTSEVGRSVAVGLYPNAITPAAVEAADAFLADTSLPAGLRRLVSEGRDDVQRALRARRRDAAAQ